MTAGAPNDVRELLFGDLWEYSPAPATTDHLSLAKRYGHIVAGASLPGDHHVPSYNPADEQLLYELPTGDDPIIKRAVGSARHAARGWRALPGVERAWHLYRLGRRLTERGRDLGLLETLDTGRPVRQTLDVDVPLAAAQVLYCAGWADKLGFAFPRQRARPLGVVGLLIASDTPLLSMAQALAPALATGNTVVVAPAAATSLTALQLARLVIELGWPPGVVNVVLGGHATGLCLARHRGVDAIAWDGPADGLDAIREVLAGSGRRLIAHVEDPTTHVILADAPLDEALESVANELSAASGCRLLVQEPIVERLLTRLRRRLGNVRVGAPLDRNTDVGPLPTRERVEAFLRWVAAGQAEGASWHALDVPLPEHGCYPRPGIFTGVVPGHGIARGAIGGPGITVQSFRTPDEALSLAAHGTATAVWTDKGSKFAALAGSLRSSVVWGNSSGTLDAASPAGGPAGARLGDGPLGGVPGLAAFVRRTPKGAA